MALVVWMLVKAVMPVMSYAAPAVADVFAIDANESRVAMRR
jgi:hypothetical protein